MSRKIQIGFLFLLLGLSIATQSSFAQADPPLNFGNNFFVTGNYVVAGAHGLNASFGSDGFGTGIISFPDWNPGIRGTTTVPRGANIVAALLYWQTVEKVGATAGGPGTGQNGFFGPVFNGKAQLYPISGLSLPSHNAVSFSNGGCSGTSTGKIVKTYRTDVRGFLPLDANGNVLVDKADGVTFEVRLPNVGNNTPLTFGATLLLIYRVIDPDVPLNVITIYDGAFAPNATPNLTMSQSVQGFYQAAASPVSKLTHIVGAGKSNKFQQAFLGGGQGVNQRAATALPSPYGNGQPAFPGFYVNWDNTTWVFPDTKFPNVGNLANPLQENDDTASAMVVASGGNPGCVSWSATVVSTTVHDDDKDGILQVWKQNQGYCDAAFTWNGGPCTKGDLTNPAWVPLPGATKGEQDVFAQIDYMCSSSNNANPLDNGNKCDGTYDFNPFNASPDAMPPGLGFGPLHLSTDLNTDPCKENVIQKVVDAFADVGCQGRTRNYFHQQIVLHAMPGNAVPEQTCLDNMNKLPCAFPSQPGVVGWKGGLAGVKNQPINYADNGNPADCINPPIPQSCLPRLQHGKKDSYHYVLFGHALGHANWSFIAGTLTDATGTGPGKVVALSSNTLTFYTTTAHGLVAHDAHMFHANDRVTIADAVTNPNLDGTFYVTATKCPTNNNTIPPTPNDCSIQNTTAGSYSFTIQPRTPVAAGTTYTLASDPNLNAASGQAGDGSGFSDLGGEDSLITLGNWGANANPKVIAGTFMHEFGHSVGLSHGGLYYDNLPNDPNDYRPTIEANCKPNFLSVMTYHWQKVLLDNTTLDYAENWLPNPPAIGTDALGENGAATAFFSFATPPYMTPPYKSTQWFYPWPGVGGLASVHCDGTPILDGAKVSITPLTSTGSITWTAPQDINFDGNSKELLRGHSDWAPTFTATQVLISPGVDLRHIGATGSLSVAGGSGSLGGGSGSLGGGSGSLGGGSGSLGGGSGSLGGGSGSLGGGSGSLGGGSGSLGGGTGDLTLQIANAVTLPPENLTAMESLAGRSITLNWNAPGFGIIASYNIYRSDDGGKNFNKIASVNAPTTTFTDHPPCKLTGYQYVVTAALGGTTNVGQESGPSNIVSTGQNNELLTACYGPAGFTFSVPANAVQGGLASITWTLQDLTNTSDTAVNIAAANTLVVVSGPLPSSCATVGDTPILTLVNGTPTPTAQSGVSTFSQSSPGQYTLKLDTDVFCAGNYTVKLTLDSTQTASAPLQLQIDVTDTDSAPHVTTTAIPNGVVGTSYSSIISEHGGVTVANPFVWGLANGSNPLPAGLSLTTAPDGVSGLLSGLPTTAGMFSFTVQVTDAKGNIGTQTLTMTVTTPVAQINQPLVRGSSVPGAAAFMLTLNGTGFGPHSQVLWNGSSPTTTFISNTQLTAAIPASDVQALGTASVSVSNPVTVSNQPVPNSNVDFFQITPITSASLSRTDYATGINPLGLIAADFNGDGKLDLATANNGDKTVSILLGNGDGTFIAKPALMTGAGSVPLALAAGDFNHDGKIDLAVTDFANNVVSIFLGNGDGTFKAPVTYAVGRGPLQVLTGDFNRDGKLDLAVDNQNDHTISILLGNGDGTFQAQVVYAGVPAAAATKDVAGVTLGDFNRDGKLDLVVTNPSNNTVSVLIGNGDGTFQAPVAYATGNQPTNVGVADFNGDGILDLAVTNQNKTVSILLGNGDGTFQANVDYATTSGASVGPSAVTTGDFNGDGKVDLAISNENDNSVSILLGNGDGTFQAPLEFATGNLATGVAAGDFNGDGRLDVAVADFGAISVSIMLQRPEPATNLAVSNVTASQVSLTWITSKSTTVIGYNVYRGTTQGGLYTKVNMAIVAAPAFPDITVASGTTYYYVVTAVDPGNLESVNSNEVSATTPPVPPTNISVSNVTTSQVTVNWTASATASVAGATVFGYNVYRGTASGGPYTTKLNMTIVAAPPFIDPTVASGTTYYYVVTAVGPNNAESVLSTEASATTP